MVIIASYIAGLLHLVWVRPFINIDDSTLVSIDVSLGIVSFLILFHILSSYFFHKLYFLISYINVNSFLYMFLISHSKYNLNLYFFSKITNAREEDDHGDLWPN